MTIQWHINVPFWIVCMFNLCRLNKSQTVHFKNNWSGELRSLVWAACQPDQSAVTAKYGHSASCGPTYFARHRYFTHKRARAHSTTHIRSGECERAFLT